MKKIYTIIIVIVFNLLLPMESNAQNSNVSNAKSDFSVRIIENPIKILKVQTPTFDDYQITDLHQISAKSDLVLKIQVNNQKALSSWEIKYEISTFEKTHDNVELANKVILNIGKGILQLDGKNVDNDVYNAHELSLGSEASDILVQVNKSNSGIFCYSVPKENISINFSGSVEIGEYKAIQTITLINTPNISK